MTIQYKLLGQSLFGSNVTAYTVPLEKSALISSIFVTNTDANEQSYDILVVPNGESPSTKHYLRKDVIIDLNDFHVIETKISLSAGDSIILNSSFNAISVNIFGAEL